LTQKQKEVERYLKEIKTLKIQKEKINVPACLNCISKDDKRK